tara:strand:+ start:10219 stop:10956 length:738 start_codon:yes stop_codon:yes gene_type:complete
MMVKFVNYDYMNINIYKTKEELSDKLSNYIIENHLESSIALSGGSTPILLFKSIKDKLSEFHNLKTKFYWVDERCVSPDSQESNYKMTKENLFGGNIFNPENIYRIKGENDPANEVISYNNQLKESLPLDGSIPILDLVILGLGDDGHTASLFPHEFLNFRNINECLVATHPTSGQKRISLSEKIINNAKEVIFHVTGSGKKHVIDKIINKRDNYKSFPGSYIKPKSSNLSWYLDFDASEMLTKE